MAHLHRGSALRLLGLLCAGSSALWICIYSLWGRLPLAWLRLALPLLAVLPLTSTRVICERQLAGPQGEALGPPLARLHAALGLTQYVQQLLHLAGCLHHRRRDTAVSWTGDNAAACALVF